MLAVHDEPAFIEVELAAGALCCPSCAAPLGPWGWARRRTLRTLDRVRRLRPRRTRCRGCQQTHVLLPQCALSRRADDTEVIGLALHAHNRGAGHRRIASWLRRPEATVRGWLRRFAARAELIRQLATRMAYRIDVHLIVIEPRGSPARDALHALGVAVGAVVRHLGEPRSPWDLLAVLSGGALLSPGPFPAYLQRH
jgi:hypothetical protein